MTMNPERGRVPNPLIDQLTQELEPVRAIRLRDGLALVALAMVGTVLAVEFIDGLWRGAFAGEASAFFVIGNGLLLVLGLAAATSAVGMASPRVGNRHEGPKWAMAMAAVLPAGALLSLLGHDHPASGFDDPYGLECMTKGLIASLLVTGSLVVWLRRGAPVSASAAGLLVGTAAASLGSVAYGLACPIDTVAHIGIWHFAPVPIGALIGRLALPPLLRW
ncbi:NrsF family protein [Erythrobacter sp. HKB08]|uniref:NrsF family protein n=1 Tax=Erythrobacter sp. HKB08 TaxID=2502843 RepID=UPI001F2AAD93|nr:DUF1109 domain-containing protein [Erythrobacter sp. HKB08]